MQWLALLTHIHLNVSHCFMLGFLIIFINGIVS